jgi:hypothetical protein
MVFSTYFKHNSFNKHLMIGMQTQERVELTSDVMQLELQGNISTNKENIENDDDSDWLHRNDAYLLQRRHHQQAHYPIVPTMASGIILNI